MFPCSMDRLCKLLTEILLARFYRKMVGDINSVQRGMFCSSELQEVGTKPIRKSMVSTKTRVLSLHQQRSRECLGSNQGKRVLFTTHHSFQPTGDCSYSVYVCLLFGLCHSSDADLHMCRQQRGNFTHSRHGAYLYDAPLFYTSRQIGRIDTSFNIKIVHKHISSIEEWCHRQQANRSQGTIP